MLQFGLRAHDLGRLPAEQLADTLAQYRPSSIQLALSKALSETNTISSIEKMANLLHRLDSPNLQVIYDPVNLVPLDGQTETQDSFFRRAMDSFGSRRVAVHAKDFRMEAGKKTGTLPARTGDLDYPALLHLLYQQKPWIDVLLEDCSPSSAGPALDFVRSLMTASESINTV